MISPSGRTEGDGRRMKREVGIALRRCWWAGLIKPDGPFSPRPTISPRSRMSADGDGRRLIKPDGPFSRRPTISPRSRMSSWSLASGTLARIRWAAADILSGLRHAITTAHAGETTTTITSVLSLTARPSFQRGGGHGPVIKMLEGDVPRVVPGLVYRFA
jgi:hypothetical protein